MRAAQAPRQLGLRKNISFTSGGRAKVTAFPNGRRVRFWWSPDESELAVLRERVESDVVLLRDGEPRRP